MTRTTPRRLMTLHRSHIGFTLALTFTTLSLCPEPVSDPSPAQVVGAQFHLNPVTWQYPDVVHPHLARDVRQHVVPVVQFDPELRVGQRLGYGAFNLYDIFFGQGPPQVVTRWLKPNEYLTTSEVPLPPTKAFLYPPEPPFCVNTRGPFSVTATVFSKWAEREPSAV
jgi:hypothetical protein